MQKSTPGSPWRAFFTPIRRRIQAFSLISPLLVSCRFWPISSACSDGNWRSTLLVEVSTTLITDLPLLWSMLNSTWLLTLRKRLIWSTEFFKSVLLGVAAVFSAATASAAAAGIATVSAVLAGWDGAVVAGVAAGSGVAVLVVCVIFMAHSSLETGSAVPIPATDTCPPYLR